MEQLTDKRLYLKVGRIHWHEQELSTYGPVKVWAAFFSDAPGMMLGGGHGWGLTPAAAILDLEYSYPETWLSYQGAPILIARNEDYLAF